MKNYTIEESLKHVIDRTPTVDFEKLAEMPFVKMKEHDYITRQQGSPKHNKFRNFSVAVSCCLVFMACFSGWLIQYRLPDSVIILDVNPSIEIVTSRQDQILTVEALNEDAKKIVGNMDYKKAGLNGTMDQLIASMIQHGYLSANKNTLLFSVENKNIKKAESLSLALEKEIKKSVSKQDISVQIVRQVFTEDAAASVMAGKYDISAGKVKLIQTILSRESKFSFEALAKMSIDDIIAVTKHIGADSNKIIKPDEPDSDLDQDDGPAQPTGAGQSKEKASIPAVDLDDDKTPQMSDDEDPDDFTQEIDDEDPDDFSQEIDDEDPDDFSQKIDDEDTDDDQDADDSITDDSSSPDKEDATWNPSVSEDSTDSESDESDSESDNPSDDTE